MENDEIKEFLNPDILVDRATIKKCLVNAVAEVKERGERDNIIVVLIKVCEKE